MGTMVVSKVLTYAVPELVHRACLIEGLKISLDDVCQIHRGVLDAEPRVREFVQHQWCMYEFVVEHMGYHLTFQYLATLYSLSYTGTLNASVIPRVPVAEVEKELGKLTDAKDYYTRAIVAFLYIAGSGIFADSNVHVALAVANTELLGATFSALIIDIPDIPEFVAALKDCSDIGVCSNMFSILRQSIVSMEDL